MCLLATPINIIQFKPESLSPKSQVNEEADTTTISVPTFPAETAPQQVDITSLTSAELSELKSDDPFMYYSIPSVRDAALRGRDVDASVLDVRSKCPSLDGECSKFTATRQTRISAESHPDLLFEEMFADEDFMASLKMLQSDASPSFSSNDDDDLYEGSLFEYLLELNESR